MNTPDSRAESSTAWFKSSYSNGAGGECVECSRTGDGTLVRDSKQGDGPVVGVRARAWRAFVGALGSAEPWGVGRSPLP
ncbi:DUF397 domain-containing protein [Streptomyces sp. NPDC005485]|uniref:DUF397 domain-containing protein n=1 Tax=Streptomyces sp. NPDC005485 TaxID=3155591 RepID=UPI0033AFE3E6